MGEYGDDVYAAGVEDAEDLDPAENLTGDGTRESLDEPEETRWDPPDHEPAPARRGMTLAEQQRGESLDQRLSEEEPDVGAENSRPADPDRAGRLVAPDEGAHPDEESDAVATDVGRAGYAASSEEAAMHIVDEDELNEQDTNEEDTGDGF
ncbi:MAG TPA: DUF5709 domain-containing protein [Jatrophihabitans sp.]|nr:DUF5709 domain-containing protein [Jatrophihabitans sp.]